MPSRPILSLCIPTYNRAGFLEAALRSGLAEVAGLEPGTVEMLVCDNASSDATPVLLAGFQATHPELRVVRQPENLGFDRNYLSCVEQARGEFVWVMGDDDEWRPGSVARVLRELEAGADACLCLAEVCDQDLKPITVLRWYLDPEPPAVRVLNDRADLIRYFNDCAYNAAAFAFISVAVLRRERFLSGRAFMEQGIGEGYVHLWGMMPFFKAPLRLHYIPEVLVRNRLGDQQPEAATEGYLYRRWTQDLWNWARVADGAFADDPELHGAFSRIVGRNHHNTILPGLRRTAVTEEAWRGTQPMLVRAGFSPVRIAAVDFAHQHLYGKRLPMPGLDPATLCLADLPLVVRGARRIACLALGGVGNLCAGAGVLAALRRLEGARRIRVCCPAECAPLLDGFEVQGVAPGRYAADPDYREAMAGELAAFAPELVVNLDPERGIEADDLLNAALPAGAAGFELPARGQDARTLEAADRAYNCLVPRDAPGALGRALGLEPAPPALWPAPAVQAEARELLAQLGWDPARTLAVLGGERAGLADPGFQTLLERAARAGWSFLGMGDRGCYRGLETLLGPQAGRNANLAGVLTLEAMVALLQQVGGFLGGAGLLRELAGVCGCSAFLGTAEH